MIANLFRNLLASLSFFYKNNLELVKKKDRIILKNIRYKLNKLSQKNQSLKKTHKIFNKKIIFLLENGNLYNFLRNNLIGLLNNSYAKAILQNKVSPPPISGTFIMYSTDAIGG